MRYALSSIGYQYIGKGENLTIPTLVSEFQAIVAIVRIKIPGRRHSLALKIAWVDPVLASAIGLPPDAIGAIGTILPGSAPFPQTYPSVSGSPQAGRVLTANVGTWTRKPTGYRIQWLRGNTAIPGATSRTYKLGAADVGNVLRVRITPIKSGHTIETVTTSSTPRIAKATPTLSAKVAKKRLKSGARASVTVRVRASGIAPTGKVTVRFGKRKVTKPLGKNGRITVRSPKLKHGTVKVKVSYARNRAVAKRALTAKQSAKLSIRVR